MSPTSTLSPVAVIGRETHLHRGHGAFRIERILPGVAMGARDDRGFGGLGLVDHANLLPGLLVRMHEHRNDEIVSYLRSGQMRHRDDTGTVETVSATHLMVMNAGAGFSHEEEVVGTEPIDMLQIFIRPHAADLAPRVQFTHLHEGARRDWRLLVGPEGSDAPASVRQEIYVFDRHLPAGEKVALAQMDGFDVWLYVFAGRIAFGDEIVEERCALQVLAPARPPVVVAEIASDLVLFLVDRNAPASREGTLSGR